VGLKLQRRGQSTIPSSLPGGIQRLVHIALSRFEPLAQNNADFAALIGISHHSFLS